MHSSDKQHVAARHIAAKADMLPAHIIDLPQMELAKLKLFANVAELGSLTKAAIMLDSTQSSISRQLSALERECGARLFHRTGRGVSLTQFGDRLLPRVRALLLQIDQLAQDIHSTAGVPVGEVRLGMLPSMTHPLVSLLFRAARKKYPGIRLRIYEGLGGQLEEWLTTGRIDVAILFRYGKGTPVDAELLARVDAYLVGPANDPITRSPTVRFAQLDRLPLVLTGPPSRMRLILDQISRRKRIQLSVLLEADSLAIQKDIVAAGDAYAVLALPAVYREVQMGHLQAAKIVNPRIERAITLSASPHHPQTLAARTVIQLIQNLVEEFTGAFTWQPNASPRGSGAGQPS